MQIMSFHCSSFPLFMCPHTCTCSSERSRSSLNAKCPDREGAFTLWPQIRKTRRRQVSDSLKPPMFQHKRQWPFQQKALCTLQNKEAILSDMEYMREKKWLQKSWKHKRYNRQPVWHEDMLMRIPHTYMKKGTSSMCSGVSSKVTN